MSFSDLPPLFFLSSFFHQGMITNILDENVVQPLLVSTSAVRLAGETVRSIMKVDDIVSGGFHMHYDK